MKHLRSLAVLVVIAAVALAVGSAALAARPKAGTTFEGDGVTAKVGTDRTAIKKIVARGETDKYVVRDVKVKKGKFKTMVFGGSGFDPAFVIDGKFKSPKRATGYYTTPLVSGDTRYDFTLKPR